MMAAIRASHFHQPVVIFESNAGAGKKLLLSGKGRCNLTNACGLEDFLARFSGKGQFLRDAFKLFFNRELMQFFERRGVRLQVERQERVFPAQGRSCAILDAMLAEIKDRKVILSFRSPVRDLIIENGAVSGVIAGDGKRIASSAVILATGGVSYSFTGSDGSGLDIARRAGHTVTTLRAGLVGLETVQAFPRRLEGLSLKNITVKFCGGKHKLVSEVGEMMFTGYGISGPLVLTLSGRIIDWLDAGESVYAAIDLKPALCAEKLDEKLLREFRENSRKVLSSIMEGLMPKRMAEVFLDACGLDPDKKASQVTAEERRIIVSMLKGWRFDISGPRPIEEAMVTRGGVSLKEVDPRTMGSKLVRDLYFCGEMLDIDADTGGFNLQAAFSTGYLAGESAGRRVADA